MELEDLFSTNSKQIKYKTLSNKELTVRIMELQKQLYALSKEYNHFRIFELDNIISDNLRYKDNNDTIFNLGMLEILRELTRTETETTTTAKDIKKESKRTSKSNARK